MCVCVSKHKTFETKYLSYCEYDNTKFLLFNVRYLLSINSSYIWYFLKATNDLPICLFQTLVEQIFEQRFRVEVVLLLLSKRFKYKTEFSLKNWNIPNRERTKSQKKNFYLNH